jgi:hypothetical protein
MRRTAQAHIMSSLAVILNVAAPTTITLTAHETVRIDRLAHSATDGLTASRHGDLLRPGTNTIHLDRGTYHFRTAGDAQLHVTDSDKVTMTTSRSNKVIDPQTITQPGPDTVTPFDGKRGGGIPDHIPSLTVSYGDAA